MLTNSAQRTKLRNDILTKSAPGQPLQVPVAAGDWDTVAVHYNSTSSFIAWRTRVPLQEVADAQLNAELVTLTATNLDRFRAMMGIHSLGMVPTQDLRSAMENIWSGAAGTNTRVKIGLTGTLWKRALSVIEALQATGTGTDANPGTIVVEGQIGAQELSDVYNQLVV